MSAPHCPATVLVMRHADAAYERPEPSDDGGRLTDAGTAQVERLAERLRTRRVAAVYASPVPCAQQTGAILADRLGVGCAELSRVGERGDTESARQRAARFRAALEEVADQHRGETVVVISHGDAITAAILEGGLRETRWLRPGAVAEVSIGPDGWQLVHWPGSTDPAVHGPMV